MRAAFLRLGAITTLALTSLGCGGPVGGTDQLAGKITFKGEPVRFLTLVVTGLNNKTAGGATNDNGEYLIPEPPQGTLKFQFITAGTANKTNNKSGSSMRLPEKYARPNNGVTFDYTGGKQRCDIDLQP